MIVQLCKLWMYKLLIFSLLNANKSDYFKYKILNLSIGEFKIFKLFLDL